MASRFLMQIVDRQTGEIIQYEPGRRAEILFVEDCIERIVELGVGFGRTQKHVVTDIRAGIESAILALKAKIEP